MHNNFLTVTQLFTQALDLFKRKSKLTMALFCIISVLPLLSFVLSQYFHISIITTLKSQIEHIINNKVIPTDSFILLLKEIGFICVYDAIIETFILIGLIYLSLAKSDNIKNAYYDYVNICKNNLMKTVIIIFTKNSIIFVPSLFCLYLSNYFLTKFFIISAVLFLMCGLIVQIIFLAFADIISVIESEKTFLDIINTSINFGKKYRVIIIILICICLMVYSCSMMMMMMKEEKYINQKSNKR